MYIAIKGDHTMAHNGMEWGGEYMCIAEKWWPRGGRGV